MTPDWLPPDWTRNRSVKQLAVELGVSVLTILDRMEIPPLPPGDPMELMKGVTMRDNCHAALHPERPDALPKQHCACQQTIRAQIDDAILTQHETKSPQQIANENHVTRNYVRDRADCLRKRGLFGKWPLAHSEACYRSGQQPPWTSEEDVFIVGNYAQQSNSWIARQLPGRTTRGVNLRALTLRRRGVVGLKKVERVVMA